MIYENSLIFIEEERSEVPWLKIFAKKKCKEMSDCDKATKEAIFKALEFIEKEMIKYFKPEKINIASFGNYVPQVHWHIMARFKNDSFFPEPMWGKKQRESNLKLPDFEIFYKNIKKILEENL
ncbi:HIT family protein [Nitrosophilus kaiyonis]|uniref:HIT family protein n=1 Tax=Nitrosophilus kaiyonis TaxID=2930200 RepID=UPI0024903C38|nr:HIT family protein [Nitrosophilus kaiyonis]